MSLEKEKLVLNRFAIASLIAGIACYFNFMGFEKAALPILFGILALRDLKKYAQSGKNFAIGGIVLGIVQALLIGAFWIRFFQKPL